MQRLVPYVAYAYFMKCSNRSGCCQLSRDCSISSNCNDEVDGVEVTFLSLLAVEFVRSWKESFFTVCWAKINTKAAKTSDGTNLFDE